MTNENTTTTSTSTATAQGNECAGMFASPQKEHEWLRQLLGEWTFEAACAGEPGKPDQKFRGTERVTDLGGLWIIGEGEGEMPGGGKSQMRITIGFDPKRDRYVGTWFGSMMTHLWIYEGELDESGRVLTLSAEGPSFSGDGTMAQYNDIIEIKSKDHRTLTSRVLGPDGKWTQFMTSHYRRVK